MATNNLTLVLILIIGLSGIGNVLTVSNNMEIEDEYTQLDQDKSTVDDINQQLNDDIKSLQDEREDILIVLRYWRMEYNQSEVNVSALNLQIDEIKIQLLDNSTTLTQLQLDLNDSLSTSSEQSDALNASIESLQNDILSLNTTIVSLNSSLLDLQQQLSANNATIVNLQQQLSANNAAIVVLQSQSDYYQNLATTLSGNITVLEEQIEQLENGQLTCSSNTKEMNGKCISKDVVWTYLPFQYGFNITVSQASNGFVSHNDHMLNAVDFPIPENTTIVAAISGIVIQVVENFSTGCPTSACENESNFVIIDHGDSTFAMYAHLTVNGSLVEVGDSVDAGQNIALSGNTGWSTGPHLHFEIKDLSGHSMPLLFYEFENISGGSPFWGVSATSENIYVNSGLTFDYSSCQSNQFITMGIQLNSSIPCSVAELDRVYVLTGQTFSPQQRFGVAQYDVDDSQWVYTCYASNADGTFTIDLEWDSTTFTESSYLMLYSADANCYSYQSWYNSIGLWLI